MRFPKAEGGHLKCDSPREMVARGRGLSHTLLQGWSGVHSLGSAETPASLDNFQEKDPMAWLASPTLFGRLPAGSG